MPDHQVASEHFPYLPIRLLVAAQTIETEALLDAGFDGAVVIPADVLALEIPPDSHAPWSLADGSRASSPSMSAYFG